MDTRQELKDYATEYKIGEYILVWKGKSWAIMDGQFCYNKKFNDFEYEPLPSSRNEKFFKECRFGLEEAKKIIEDLNKK
jgi:hypothetical protein